MNWDILGHEWAVNLLREHVKRDQLRHAYLFTGPRGIGRRTLAIRFAQAINCQEPISLGEPCLKCQTCKQLGKLQHPDLSIVQAEKEGENLKVDAIREVQYSLALHPYASHYRIALFLRFEQATIQAMNALLKTLEEPNSRVIILITAENVEELLPTIVSRCQLIRLRPVAMEKIHESLRNNTDLSDEEVSLLAHISNGRPGIALNLSQQSDILQQRKEWLDDLFGLLSASLVERFGFADTFLDSKNILVRPKFRNLLEVWLPYWRDVLIKNLKADIPITNIDRESEIEKVSSRLEIRSIYQMIKNIERTLDLLSKNVNGRLIAEITMMDLPYIGS
jgi:DNA polymerase III subunit delta'